MTQIASSYWFEEIRDALDEIGGFLGGIIQYITNFFNTLPSFVRTVFFFLLFFTVTGILLSHAIAVYKIRREWMPKPDSKLMFSYFCGTGSFQRKLIYQEAHKLLRNKTWSWVSIAGLAWRLGNYTHPSKMLMFACSLLYLPMAIFGFVEMVLRDIIGTVWLLCASLAHRLILFVLRWISYLLIPLWQLADRFKRVEHHCPHCYNTFNLPEFKCPYCGSIHKALIPSRCGILFARCECGRFLPSTLFTGRSNLDPVCPKCDGDLVATNAKQFSIQLIGGNTSGKTAFLSAFQHLYLNNNIGKLSIHGEPRSDFEKMEEMFKRGTTEPSSSATAKTYNLVHRYGRSARNNLVVHDIPDEVILSGDYERNPLYFGYSDGIIIMIDPLSVASVRERCLKSGNNKAVENYSQDDADTIIVRFIHKFSEIVGRSARKMINTPVAVLISKTDVKAIKREVGLPKIKATYNANPSAYQNDFGVARDEVCREYLLNLGLTNALNNLESVFSSVRYFPISAIGHICEAGKPFEPFGVMEPMTWIANEARSDLYSLLKNTQDFITVDEKEDASKEHLLSERYQQADILLQNYQLDAALKIFISLKDYRDSAKRVDDIKTLRYQQAEKLLSTKQYIQATDIFKTLGKFKDAPARKLSTRYLHAEALLADKEYQDALSIFKALGNYKDASARALDVRYQQAEALLAQEDYIGVLTIFSDLGNYKDSEQRVGSLLTGLIKQGQTKDLSFGSYKWRVLTVNGGKALLLTENLIENRAYHTDRIDVTWENCTLLRYLNGEFYNQFSSKEKAMITSSNIANPSNGQHGTAGGNSTTDSVFLLNIDEATHFFANNEDRIAKKSGSEQSGWWWLRSPGGKNIYAAIVDGNGKISAGGNTIDNASGGLRPALWLNL